MLKKMALDVFLNSLELCCIIDSHQDVSVVLRKTKDVI